MDLIPNAKLTVYFFVYTIREINTLNSLPSHFNIQQLNGFRIFRDLDIGKSGNGGTRITAGHGATLYDNPNHRLDSSAFGSKTFRPSGPLSVGGQLDYTHKPSGNFNLKTKYNNLNCN